MATAKKNTRNKKTAEKKSIPWWPVTVSFLTGAFMMFLWHLYQNVPPQQAEKPKPVKKVEKKKSNAIEPKFDFYTVLPEMEVVVDDKPKSKPIVSTPPQKQVATSKKTQEKQRFLLQVGSFKNLSDADSLKAKLAFLGIESKIQTVTVDNKSTWHRVQIGPILGRDKVDSLQKQLKQNSIDSLLMRAKQG